MTVEQLKQIFTSKGYKWDPLINVIGIRNLSIGRKVTNKFDDTLVVAYFVNGMWRLVEYKCTTDPGAYYVRKKLLNPKGVAILKAGQYLDTYAIRLHQGKYEALCQTYNKVTVYRDANKNDVYDLTVTDYMREMGYTLDKENLKHLIIWVINDIKKEESDVLAENKLDIKQVNKYISNKVKDYYLSVI